VRKSLLAILSLGAIFAGPLRAQTLYVDAQRGQPASTGSAAAPLASLDQAVTLAQQFSGREPVVLRLAPGLYTLTRPQELKTSLPAAADTVRYTLEATVMPDDTAWTPTKMPVIQSVSPNNSTYHFAHAIGLLVAKGNVRFRGLKFVGNANPAVKNYYPITRENEELLGLTISQCYFVGERNSAPIQGALWAHGAGDIRVDHSIFYECKNALIIGVKSRRGFSVTHCVIYGAYEAAIWFDPNEATFTGFAFRNNIVAGGGYVWINDEHTTANFTLRNSLITNNEHYTGYYTGTELLPTLNHHVEQGVQKQGTVRLRRVKTEGLPPDYLNPLPQSAGYGLHAGIFITRKP